MKSIMISLIISVLALIGNTENVSGKDNFCKNKEVNKAGKTVKRTVRKGKDGKNLKPIKRYENKYDSNGNLYEKTLSVWDSNQLKWNVTRKYQYEYTANRQLKMLSYTTPYKSGTVIYIYNLEGELVSIDSLKIGNKDKEVLASDFSIK